MSYNRWGGLPIPELYMYWDAGFEKPTLTIHGAEDLHYSVEQVEYLVDRLQAFLMDVRKESNDEQTG